MNRTFRNTLKKGEIYPAEGSKVDCTHDYRYASDETRERNYAQSRIADYLMAISGNEDKAAVILRGCVVTYNGNGTVTITEGEVCYLDEDSEYRYIFFPGGTYPIPAAYSSGSIAYIRLAYEAIYSGETQAHYRGEQYHRILIDSYVGNTTSSLLFSNSPEGVILVKFTYDGTIFNAESTGRTADYKCRSADTLDGQHGAYYLNRDNHTGAIDYADLNTELKQHIVDGIGITTITEMYNLSNASIFVLVTAETTAAWGVPAGYYIGKVTNVGVNKLFTLTSFLGTTRNFYRTRNSTGWLYSEWIETSSSIWAVAPGVELTIGVDNLGRYVRRKLVTFSFEETSQQTGAAVGCTMLEVRMCTVFETESWGFVTSCGVWCPSTSVNVMRTGKAFGSSGRIVVEYVR